MNSENVVIIGGHSVDDQEIKIGYAVTGTIHPDRVITNSGARPGDVLVLTKPIGTGAINTAVKNGVARRSTEEAAIAAMSTSAATASATMVRARASACTDVTGFGLLGHAFEMANGSGALLTIDSKAVPLLPDVIELISQGMLTRGDRNNRIYVGDTVRIADSVSKEMQSALFDPQTAGGLLISLNRSEVERLLSEVDGSNVIGEVSERTDRLVEVK